jgi:hypothetical protein
MLRGTRAFFAEATQGKESKPPPGGFVTKRANVVMRSDQTSKLDDYIPRYEARGKVPFGAVKTGFYERSGTTS